jgi:hypothetical protein
LNQEIPGDLPGIEIVENELILFPFEDQGLSIRREIRGIKLALVDLFLLLGAEVVDDKLRLTATVIGGNIGQTIVSEPHGRMIDHTFLSDAFDFFVLEETDITLGIVLKIIDGQVLSVRTQGRSAGICVTSCDGGAEARREVETHDLRGKIFAARIVEEFLGLIDRRLKIVVGTYGHPLQRKHGLSLILSERT